MAYKKIDLKVYVFMILFMFSFHMSYTFRTILLTGGAGFIGSHVAQALLKRGDTVILIDNFNNAYPKHLKENNIKHVQEDNRNNSLYIYGVDLRDYGVMNSIFERHKPDTICHLAARAGVRPSLEMPEEYITSNIVGTMNMFELANIHGVKHISYASSSSVYGNCTEGPFVENFDTSRPVSHYAMTKCTAELLAYTFYHIYGIHSTGLRFFTVYGPRGRVDMAPFIFMDALYHDKAISVFGDGSSVRDFTYVADIVDGVIRSLDYPSGYQVINLGRGEPIVLKDFIAIMEEVVGKKAIINHVQMSVADVFLTHANIDKARILLGYDPKVSVKKGLQNMYAWYVREYLPMMKKRGVNK